MSGEAIAEYWNKGTSGHHVRAYGAGPSESAATNDAAFAAATTAALASGKKVIIPNETFSLSSNWAITTNAFAIESNFATLSWTADVDGITFTGDKLQHHGRLQLEGPGYASSTGTGLTITSSGTTTVEQQMVEGIQVLDFDTGVYLINVEHLFALRWKLNQNNQNLLMHDGAFNEFKLCRFSANQGSSANVEVSGAAGVGNGAGTNQCVWDLCEWLNTKAGQYALQLGASGFGTDGHIFIKPDVERNSTSLGFNIRGNNHVFIGPYFHDVAGGIRWSALTGDGVIIAPRFTSTGFGNHTIFNNSLPVQIRLIGGTGLGNGAGVTGVAEAMSLYQEASPSANLDDYDPSVNEIIRLDPSTNINLTGVSGGFAGRRIRVINVNSTNTVTLVHGSASSTAENRFSLAGATNLTLSQNGVASLWYDATSSRWRPAS